MTWYKEGLRFQCTECGQCCTGKSGFVWVSEEEMLAIANLLQIPIALFKRKYTRQRDNRYALIERKDNACVFLAGKKCQIYQARPTQCRTFPWWRENLNSEESWKLAAQDCEGINEDAPIVSYEEIIRYLEKNEG